MDSCLFCRIAAGTIPSTKVYEDDTCFAFRDINPAAPVHVLVIPKKHVANAAEAAMVFGLLESVMAAAVKIAAAEGLEANGYRLVVNTGEDAGQSVKHLHVHILGGRTLAWPPG